MSQRLQRQHQAFILSSSSLRLLSSSSLRSFSSFSRCSRSSRDEVYPLMNPTKTCLIYSQFRGYIQNSHPAFQEETYNFVHQKDWHIAYLHTSGHASKEALAAVCKKVNPLHAIIPIHRDADSDFCSLDIPQELKDKVITETPQNPIGDINIIIK